MAYRNFSTEALQQLDRESHLHPFTHHSDLRAGGSRIFSGAERHHIIDSEGRRYLDAMAGLWCVNVGYDRRELAQVAAEQMAELPYYNSFFQCTTPQPILLADKLKSLAPKGIENVFFGSSGSESNDTVVRLVRYYWMLQGAPERHVIISRENAYHGSTVAAASLGGMSAMHGQLGAMLPGVEHIMAPYAFGEAMDGESDEEFGLRAASALETRILEVGADKVAAFIAEPIQGAGGVKIPPETYWPEITRICEKYGILLCLDEVISGFGRTGEWFAAEYYGLKPDLITTAKAITSGYIPLSAVLVGERISKALTEKSGEFYHGYTYSGHPVACAVALENLRIIEEEGLVDCVKNETAPYLQQVLSRFDDHPLVGETRSLGFLGAVELVADKKTRSRFADEGMAGTTCRDICVEHNLIMRAVGDTMIMSPPLTWDREVLDEFAGQFADVLDATLSSLTE